MTAWTPPHVDGQPGIVTLTALDWVRLAACVVQLSVALLAVLRGGRSPTAMPLALLALSLFAWSSCALVWSVSGHVQWHWLEMAISPATTPMVLHLVAVVVGELRRLRRVMIASYLLLGAFGAFSGAALVSPAVETFVGTPAWALVAVALMLPVLGIAAWLLIRHRRRVDGIEERLQASLLLLALATTVVFAITELVADLGVGVPRLASTGAAVGAAIVGFATLRSSLLGRPVDTMVGVHAVGLATLGVLAHVLVFRTLGTSTTMLVVGTVSVTLGVLAAARRVAGDVAVRAARQTQLAALGRVSAQMAHDLRNPLAAVKGTVQFLQEERASGRSIDGQDEFLALMADQLDRMKSIIEHYQVAVSLEAAVAPLSVNDVVREVLSLQRFADTQVVVESKLADGLPDVPGDRQLLTRALHNLVRNGCDAMPTGGTLTVTTSLEGHGRSGRAVVVTVEDTGIGMDPGTRERIFESFFTTKSGGTGLGLPFVRRVAEAHGGDVSIFSVPGHGTVVRLSLPSRASVEETRGNR
ncbi:MAG: two-component sensor histidine kinase [Deltaproteobacteria bacterium]|nr:two-component sensor histidine kinase [Deltaproteobacteria bacterium]